MIKSISNSVGAMGRPLTNGIEYTANVLLMVYLSFRSTLFEQSQGIRTVVQVIAAQMYFTGYQALGLLSILAAATGTIVLLNTGHQSVILGNEQLAGHLLYVIVVRELGPFITALIVVARSGTAVASELGNMKVHREMDALNVMAINPLSFVVFPRLVGGTLSVFCLAFYFSLVAIVFGFITAWTLHGMSLNFFLNSFTQLVTFSDLLLVGGKNLTNGVIVFSISCFQGMQVKQSPHEVPQATTKAVVMSITLISTISILISFAWYIFQLLDWGITWG